MERLTHFLLDSARGRMLLLTALIVVSCLVCIRAAER
jgi:hypothetical protein